MEKKFYGWWIVAAALFTFGFAVGVPYYNVPFFADYYMKSPDAGGFGWTRQQVILGFPLATTLLMWMGPLIVPRFSPRKLIVIGTGLTALAFLGWSKQDGNLYFYYAMWLVYAAGYFISGPVVHQVIVSQWFKRKRGFAMGVVYVGVGLMGSIVGDLILKPMTKADPTSGFRDALLAIGGMVLLAWPLAILFLKDKPGEIGQFADGADAPPEEAKLVPVSMNTLFRSPAFWLLMVGSFCSIGSIGAINQHMKLAFKDQGFTDQLLLNDAAVLATKLILWSSIAGRLFVGWAADRLSKKAVMVATYVLVAATIPILLLVNPAEPHFLYLFAILFGFGMGADYMLIPLMAAEQFGVNSLARAMSIILPTDTIGQTWFPYGVAWLRESWGTYQSTLMVIFALSFIGAVAIALLPSAKKDKDEVLPVQDTARVGAGN
jgi:MFS family permease